ncbi:MAG: hypothetical protein CBC13_08495 [Planctomycetia bacterium TMED53]|nr:MAG: hypothetical protein CBC13_08495 [Planctomycetia bacterium TMED53]
MKIRMAQYGILHDHAVGKTRVMKASTDVDLVGICEPDKLARFELKDDSLYEGLNWFSTPQEMLEDETIEAIAVQGRVADNLSFAEQALTNNKHIWLDKPAGDDLKQFEKILSIARQKKRLVQLGYMFRYNTGFQFLLDWANNGRLGHIFSIRARISTGGVNANHWKRWNSTGERQGGIMFILACHLIDIIVALMGRPNRVTPFLRHDGIDYDWFQDNNLVVFEYGTGQAILESTALEVSAGLSRRIEVYGTKGSIVMEPLEPPKLRLCLDADRDGYKKGWQTVNLKARPRYVESLRAFVADIRGQKKPDRSLDHEYTVQETVLRAAGLHE